MVDSGFEVISLGWCYFVFCLIWMVCLLLIVVIIDIYIVGRGLIWLFRVVLDSFEWDV